MPKPPKTPRLADDLAEILNALAPGWSERLQRLGKSSQFTRVYAALSRADADGEARAYERRR